MKKISILGVTGSIGTQTLDVVRNSDDIKVVGISANSSTEKMNSGPTFVPNFRFPFCLLHE